MRREITIRAMRSFATTWLTAFAIGLLASAGWAEEDMAYHDLTTNVSTLELGAFFNSDDDFKFGDFTGLEDDGWSVLGNVDLRRRSSFDAERAYYYRIQGLNLGLDSRYIEAEYQRPGLFGVSLFYDEIPKFQTDSARVFHRNAGASFLTLPQPTAAEPNPCGYPISFPFQIDSDCFYANEIDHKRRTAGGEISLNLPSNFDFDASYEHQRKRGEKTTAAMMGLAFGTARSMLVPEPLKYTTHQIDSHIRYTVDDFQLQLQYYASGFNNDLNGLAWDNPYNGNASVGYPNGVGQKASMPDNWFHQVTGSGGINLPGNSRLMLNAAFGWGTQNDDFLPYTNNPLLFVDPARGLPRPDLNGKLETRLVTARFVSKPLPKLGINVAYRWNDRDNDTPIDSYFRVRADSENQPPNDPRINRPYSFEQHRVDADFSYKVYKRTKLTLMYQWEQMNRNLQEVHKNNEHTVGGKLVSRPNQYLNLGARYERSYRDRSSYDCVKPLTAGVPPLTLANPGCPTEPGPPDVDFQNQPQLRKYNMANRRRNDTHAWMTITPLDRLSVGTHLKYIDDDYYKSTFGVTEYRLLSTGLDLSYRVTDALNFNAFYNHDKTRREMDAVSFGSNPDASFDPDNNWSSRDKDTTNTVGTGIDFDVLPDRLSLGVQYLFARSTGRVKTVTAAGGPVSPPFPDNETTLHNVSVQGNLEITRNLSMRVGYLFEDFDSSDWATEQVCPACLSFTGSAAVVATGESSPHYSAHLVSMSLIYRFW
jgi:MtrB/PioB family decaheme-associated outer membrane protein